MARTDEKTNPFLNEEEDMVLSVGGLLSCSEIENPYPVGVGYGLIN